MLGTHSTPRTMTFLGGQGGIFKSYRIYDQLIDQLPPKILNENPAICGLSMSIGLNFLEPCLSKLDYKHTHTRTQTPTH